MIAYDQYANDLASIRKSILSAGEALPGNETFVDIDMKMGETRMLRIEPM